MIRQNLYRISILLLLGTLVHCNEIKHDDPIDVKEEFLILLENPKKDISESFIKKMNDTILKHKSLNKFLLFYKNNDVLRLSTSSIEGIYNPKNHIDICLQLAKNSLLFDDTTFEIKHLNFILKGSVNDYLNSRSLIGKNNEINLSYLNRNEPPIVFEIRNSFDKDTMLTTNETRKLMSVLRILFNTLNEIKDEKSKEIFDSSYYSLDSKSKNILDKLLFYTVQLKFEKHCI